VSAQINYKKHLAEYLMYRNITVSQLIQNYRTDEAQESKHLQTFVNHMLERLASSSVANYVAAVKSRLQYDSIRPVRPIKIPDRRRHHTVESQSVPTKDQIISFLRTAKPSTQVIIALGAFLGIRFKTMSGLKVSDFPEMRISENNQIIFEKIPTRVNIRDGLNKGEARAYMVFLIEFGCVILKNHLEIRMRRGEKLDGNSLILPIEGDTESMRNRAKAIPRRMYSVFEKLGYESRPYSLKSFFATALQNTGIQQNYQSFFLGHKGPMQNEYTVYKHQPAEQIEHMRSLFKEKIEPYLVPQMNSADKVVKEEFKKLATAMGLDIKEESTTDETIEEIAGLYASAKDDLAKRAPKPASKQQKRVTEDDLDAYLNEGWEVVSTLQSGNIVIQRIS
jgi:site-specific recombinase XerD